MAHTHTVATMKVYRSLDQDYHFRNVCACGWTDGDYLHPREKWAREAAEQHMDEFAGVAA